MAKRESWRDRSVFIGGSHFSAPWLAQALVEKGAHVVTLMRGFPDEGYALFRLGKRVSAARGDVGNYRDVERTLNEYEVDTVFHAGEEEGAGSARKKPVEVLERKVQRAWKLLEACRNSRLVERIVVASSDRAYGEGAEVPYSEGMPLAGTSIRSVSDSCIDLL